MPRGKGNHFEPANDNRPHRPTKAGFKKHRSAEFYGWVNVTIPASEKPAVDEFGGSPEFIDAYEATLKKFIRIAQVYDLDQECFMATAFWMDEEHENAGFMTSQRSDDPFRALVKLVYAIDRIMPTSWRELEQAGNERW